MEQILILDFGSQYTQLIAKAIRRLNVFSIIKPCFSSISFNELQNVKGIILSGGPASVTENNYPVCSEEIFKSNIPILGICYGMQFLAKKFNGKVISKYNREYGKAFLFVSDKVNSPLLKDIPDKSTIWMSHGDTIEVLPDGWQKTAYSKSGSNEEIIAAIENPHRKLFGIQFHPEVFHTEYGKKIIANFLFNICGLKANWTPSKFIEDTVSQIKAEVKNDKIILGVSGGVDSTVAALLIHKAIGENLVPVFINNGLLRKNEAEEVIGNFSKLGIEIKYFDASDIFLTALKNVEDPEEKRKIIGRIFIESFSTAINNLNLSDINFLAQGTLYPDIIESRSFSGSPSAKIKTHHNVGGLPDDLKFKLIEPLTLLFKDDVRRVGKELGLSNELLYRHPFPGPGLAVRIISDVTNEKLELLKNADYIFVEELKKSGWYSKVSQAFAVLLPVKSVGVMGDSRTYEQVIALRAVTSEDFMTANWSELPYELLSRTANRIINEVKGINRVVYDISSKPPATIEWE